MNGLKLNAERIKFVLALLLISIDAILIRMHFINFRSGDYNAFLSQWWDFIKTNGGFSALKYNKFDYTPPYIYILTIGTYFNVNSLKYIKLISIIFDFVAATFVMLIIKKKYSNSFVALLSYATVLFLPTVILNSSRWAQCDVIFTSFIIISIYFMLCNKYTLATISYAISFSFKIQAVFALPLFGVLLFKKKVKIRDLVLIPITYIIATIPCIIAGRPIKDVLLIYMNQGKEYNELTLNMPNIYYLIPKVIKNINVDLATKIGIFATAAVVFIVFCTSVIYIKELKKENIIELALIFAVIIPFLLPRMHERYLFLADIISIVYAFYFPSRFYIAIATPLVSLFAYYPFLFGYTLVPHHISALIMLVNISIIFYHYFINILLNYRESNFIGKVNRDIDSRAS